MSETTTFLPLKGEKSVYNAEYLKGLSLIDQSSLLVVVGERKAYSTENTTVLSTTLMWEGQLFTMGLNPEIAAISQKTMVAIVETATQREEEDVPMWINAAKEIMVAETQPRGFLPLYRMIVVLAEQKHLEDSSIESGMAYKVLPAFKARLSAISSTSEQSPVNKLLFSEGMPKRMTVQPKKQMSFGETEEEEAIRLKAEAVKTVSTNVSVP